VLGVPGFDLQPVDQAAAQVTDDDGIGVRAEITVVLQTFQQHRKTSRKSPGPKSVRPASITASCDSCSAVG
jgi:hypothetical protein